MIVEKIIGKLEELDQNQRTVDKVLLDHDAMSKPHQKLKSEAGETIAVSLPHGEHLFCGAVLYEDSEKIIAVDLVPEDVLEIHPKGNLQWAKTAFNIGNMHHPAYLHEHSIVIPYDGILENMLRSIGVPYVRCMKKLDGERANYAVGGHSHSHAHGGHTHSHRQE